MLQKGVWDAQCSVWQGEEAAERERDRQRARGRVTKCPSLLQTSLVLALQVLHLEKLLSLRQIGTIAKPTKE